MSYQHIKNLYRPEAQRILAFRQVYAMEKIHRTSAHVAWRTGQGARLVYFAGGASHETFVRLFDADALTAAFVALGHDSVTVYGEAYGGKLMGMSKTYGPAMRFVAFEVKIGETWLDVPNAADVAGNLGLDFVPWRLVDATVAALDAERDRESEQAVKNGMGRSHVREGIVIRAPFECVDGRGNRLVAKHKRAEFAERRTNPDVDPTQREIMDNAEAIAFEWVTAERLRHVLDALGITDLDPRRTGDVIKGMVEDVCREASGEIADNKAVRKAIGGAAAKLYREAQQALLTEARDDH